jgi:flagellar biosynthetic protein FliR
VTVAALPALAFAFMLVLCRAGAAVMLLPGFGENEPPAMLRAGFAVALTVLLLPEVQPMLPAPPGDAWQLGRMVAAELATGAMLGWLARLVALALPIAGQIVSYMLGLSNVLQNDVVFAGGSTALNRLFGLAAPTLILASGLYELPLAALVGSYRLLPAGTMLASDDSARVAIAAVSDSFGLALQVAAPFVLAAIVWHAALGLLSRLVTNLEVSILTQPAQILGGLALLSLLVAGLIGAWGIAAREMLSALPGL